MADMIVDGVKLDACLDAEADAIRAKTGGSADIPFDFANNKGFADAIAAIVSGGGAGNTLESDFLTVYKETVEVGENTVSNASQYQSYLNSIKSVPGTLFAMSIHKKASYTNNEWANGIVIGNKPGYRYRTTWQSSIWGNASYDSVAPVGTLVDVYTVELKNPNNV